MSFHKIREQSHKNHKARVHRASGGHTDAAEDRAMVKPSALNRAKGGAAHKPKAHKPKSGKTSVNVVVAPERGSPAAPAGMGGAGLSRAPVPPVIPGGPGGLGGLGAGPAPMGPGPVGPRPGGLKKGGRAHRANGGQTYHAGAATGEGRLEKKDKYGR